VEVTTFAQVATYPPGSTFGPRTLRDYELVWVLAGSAEWSSNQDMVDPVRGGSATRTLRPGTLMLARRGSRDSYEWSADRTSSHAFVHLALTDGASYPPEAIWPSTRSLADDVVLSGLCAYLLELAAIGSDAARQRSDQIVGLVVDIFLTGPIAADVAPPFDPRITELLEYVRAEWALRGMRIINNDSLAAHATMSVGHLSRLFRHAFGLGPSILLESARLVRAATTLQRTDLPIHAIASVTGFANEYHFSRRFSRAYSMPPGRYRRAGPSGDPFAITHSPTVSAALSLLLAASDQR
jgi:AraC family transcriptional regulator